MKPSNACISRCIVTDAHDSNSHVSNVNMRITHVNNFTYLLIFLLTVRRISSLSLFECIRVAPASSALVERVLYSKSGLIVRPHHAKMSDKLLESLAFATCSSGMPFKLFTYSKFSRWDMYSVK